MSPIETAIENVKNDNSIHWRAEPMLLQFDPQLDNWTRETAIEALRKLEKGSGVDYKEYLKKKYSVGQMKKILKENKVKGYSRLREAELIDLIIANDIKNL